MYMLCYYMRTDNLCWCALCKLLYSYNAGKTPCSVVKVTTRQSTVKWYSLFLGWSGREGCIRGDVQGSVG